VNIDEPADWKSAEELLKIPPAPEGGE